MTARDDTATPQETDLSKMSNGGLRVLRRHLKKARGRILKSFERCRMHDVPHSSENGHVDRHIGDALGGAEMALDRVKDEIEERKERGEWDE